MSTHQERSAAFRRGLGLDYEFIARWVTYHERECICEAPKPHEWMGICARCMSRSRDTSAFDLGQLSYIMEVGESKVAITMKYAVKEGLANRIRDLPRGQDAWTPTDKAREMFPLDRAHVMPEHEPVEMESGTFQPLSPAEVREQTPGPALEDGVAPKRLGS